MIDLDQKQVFLQQGSGLYHVMIGLTDCDTVKRYLAFRIIVNARWFPAPGKFAYILGVACG